MPVVRTKQTENYTVLPNSILQDQRLSLRDRGLLAWMLSMPPDWKFTRAGIVEIMGLDGDRSVRSGVKKLQELGYLVITKGERKKGKLPESIWTVYDVPYPNIRVVAEESPQLQNAAMEQPDPGKLECGSPRVRFVPVVTGQEEQPQNGQPQVRFAPVDNAPDYKINNNKNQNHHLSGGLHRP